MNTSPKDTQSPPPIHIAAFDTVRGLIFLVAATLALAAVLYRFVEAPSMALGKSLPGRWAEWRAHRAQVASGT
jgi:peptidoglycan/LPS O-acetylase OafA/YrhL